MGNKIVCFMLAVFTIGTKNKDQGSFSFSQVGLGKPAAVRYFGNTKRRYFRKSKVNSRTVGLRLAYFTNAYQA